MFFLNFRITDISFMDEFQGPKAALGNRPLMIFHGEAWTSEPLEQAKSMFLDMFSGDTYSDKLDLRGVSHVICLTAPTKDKILMRTYHILLKSSGVKLPRVELVDMGPHFDFAVKRHLPANASMMKEAMRIPKELQPKKMKNISRNDFGEKTGRIWMDPQDLNKLQTRKMKGLKRKSDTTTEVVEDEDDI
jgi:ribosome production factor 2